MSRSGGMPCAATTTRSRSAKTATSRTVRCCTDEGVPMQIGANVTVGHLVMLHGCSIGDNSLIGIGSIILNRAVIGRNTIVGANTLIPEGRWHRWRADRRVSGQGRANSAPRKSPASPAAPNTMSPTPVAIGSNSRRNKRRSLPQRRGERGRIANRSFRRPAPVARKRQAREVPCAARSARAIHPGWADLAQHLLHPDARLRLRISGGGACWRRSGSRLPAQPPARDER